MDSDSQNTLSILNCMLMPITFLCRLLLVFIVLLLLRRWQVARKKKSRVMVVVLGDIGRSPRMQNHVISLVNHGFMVEFVGYVDSQPRREIIESSRVSLHNLGKENISVYFPRTFAYFVRVIAQAWILSAKLLFKVSASEYILMQNPPCIPAISICWAFSIFNGSKFAIDWHNYGHTILGLTLGKSHKLVKIAHAYEKIFGQLAAFEICVTKAMQKDLEERWHVYPIVLYDRPPEHFKPLPLKEKHKLFMRLKDEYEAFGVKNEEGSTFCSKASNGLIIESEERPAFVISSTSWTEDEDFSLLLNALKFYDNTKASGDGSLPDIVCAITGKGPMKEYYLKEIQKVNWKHVKIITPWLSAEDYPLLIGSADLGICLHTSSSGLDLPMKVVDMFGCGVPVVAVGFHCLDELVRDGENGVIFQNERGLHNNLCELLTGFPKNQEALTKMRRNLESFRQLTWSKNWDENVLPLFKK